MASFKASTQAISQPLGIDNAKGFSFCHTLPYYTIPIKILVKNPLH